MLGDAGERRRSGSLLRDASFSWEERDPMKVIIPWSCAWNCPRCHRQFYRTNHMALAATTIEYVCAECWEKALAEQVVDETDTGGLT